MFLNVDLDLRSKFGLEELLSAFGADVIDLKRQDDSCVSVEIAEQPQSAEEAILSFYTIITSLSPEMRSIWDQCEMRTMSIGIQVDKNSYSENFSLSNRILTLLSSINVDVVITAYRDDNL